ncbi:MAG: phage tail sheath subtilisin-like domain-containing protein [Pseudomonadota bacterium]|nr:phage tail sheath subtilisin-like domain-containing protein [Pseudomonadota bacterium]
MPVTVSYPGIYIQELPSSTHTITAAPTNIAVFIGYTHPLKTKPANWGKAVLIFGFADYQREFGGFLRSTAYAFAGASQWIKDGTPVFASEVPHWDPENNSFGDMASAVNQFFLNGGTQAYVVGLVPGSDPSQFAGGIAPPLSPPSVLGMTFTAREITDANFVMTLTLRPILPLGSPPGPFKADVIITYGPAPQPGVGAPPGTITESYRGVTLTPPQLESPPVGTDPNFIENRIGTADNPVSQLATVSAHTGPTLSDFQALFPSMTWTFTTASLQGSPPSFRNLFEGPDFTKVMQQDTDLDKVPIFNLMVIPGVTNSLVLSTAETFCENKRAFLIVDPPLTDSVDDSQLHFKHTIDKTVSEGTIPHSKNAALYFPYLKSPDPLTGQSINLVTGSINEIPPSATVAGVFAATDVSRGVWKAPAGFQATTRNTTGVVERGKMTDQRQGLLNPIGVDCLRDFPNIGTAVFGARTTVTLTDEQWRYVPVRRMALFLEQTFYATLGWVVFEPNDEPLWSAIRMSINAFMLGLFRQGAFQGKTPSEAFKVSCDSQTTTQTDINNGIVNIVVGFAPLKPAEFVIITISQLAGQTQTS